MISRCKEAVRFCGDIMKAYKSTRVLRKGFEALLREHVCLLFLLSYSS